MKPTFSSLLLCTLMVLLTASAPPEKGWNNLLDKKLSQWEMYLGFRHKNDFKGDAPKDENGNLIQPVGYNKNENNVFTVIEENSEPVLRISGEIYGCVYTKQDYENYHLKLKVKWGNKNWEPRIEKLKDSGILYHSIGEAGVDYWKAWMLSQEFQIMEGHVGDYWAIANSAIDIRAFIPEGQMNPVASQKRAFIPIGEGSSFGGFCLRSEDYENDLGEWTQLELVTFGDKSLHIVNGRVVMVLQNSRYVEGNKSTPLTKGKIQLQSEAAEVFFKDIQIRSIDKIPGKYAALF